MALNVLVEKARSLKKRMMAIAIIGVAAVPQVASCDEGRAN